MKCRNKDLSGKNVSVLRGKMSKVLQNFKCTGITSICWNVEVI